MCTWWSWAVQVLERPHPLFDVLSKHWTLLALPNARNGDAVYLDRVGRLWVGAGER